MFFSDYHKILYTGNDEWFDPIVSVDTKLFVDPFLIFADRDGRWRSAHDRVVGHFQVAFELLADCGCEPDSLAFRSAVRMMQFPEPKETCLGYAAQGTSGSGSGSGYARSIVNAMCDAIGRGVVELRHFEQLGILEEGFGPDRISDITTTILKPELIKYTQEVASGRGVPLARHRVRAGGFDDLRHGFVGVNVSLPTNPANGGPLLLVPKRFLRDLPSINAEDWWEDMRSGELRDELNADVASRLKKKQIVAIAKRHPAEVAAWVAARERLQPNPYDLDRDRNGVYAWGAATKRYAKQNPMRLAPPRDELEFRAVINRVIDRFRHFVEENGGWRLLWDGADEKSEAAAQLLFLGIAKSYCEANNIVIDREVELGRGPVDFKFSSGYQHRALLEVKKLENGRFWTGLRSQLPSYLKSDQSRVGWLLAVRYRDSGIANERARDLPAEVRMTAEELDLDLSYGLVDARQKPSASKLPPIPAQSGVA